VGVVFIILCTRKGPEGHTFSLIENKSSWPHVPRGTLFLIRCSVRIMLFYMIYPRGRCPFFTTPVSLCIVTYMRVVTHNIIFIQSTVQNFILWLLVYLLQSILEFIFLLLHQCLIVIITIKTKPSLYIIYMYSNSS